MSEPLLLALPNWVENRITTLYQAKDADAFNTAFDAFISHHVQIKVNGKPMSREQYKKLIMGEIKSDVSADVAFNGIVSVPDATKDRPAVVTGTVGVFFKATVFGKFLVFAHHTSSTVTSSMNVVVSHDTSIKGVDNRRVTILDEVLTDVQNSPLPTQQPPTSA
ncbi:hypothetical protein L226DRAFT_611225 [Lentinus tigrinus ALCF2SS1-7]|uniref:SnoaL-like domain-containing protein n=1 Tax=Lentinus tigrinus ALCF2SS1-6 TaxID=1328759 RepID=A0A5C2RT27_9APHY|nr:hypothetical protein L227DRAFT_581205 [Lentinus tigrinus ALCF2SS1-6]RPD76793.1 hypothetical protein L226DRAFT_611225 [Lentinus tigrinus ALCF2SS1-7]